MLKNFWYFILYFLLTLCYLRGASGSPVFSRIIISAFRIMLLAFKVSPHRWKTHLAETALPYHWPLFLKISLPNELLHPSQSLDRGFYSHRITLQTTLCKLMLTYGVLAQLSLLHEAFTT